MNYSDNQTSKSAEGIASLAILKILLDTLQKKNILDHEEIDIILNCATVELESVKPTAEMSEAKNLIIDILKDAASERGETTEY